jgi:hypothetical protein
MRAAPHRSPGHGIRGLEGVPGRFSARLNCPASSKGRGQDGAVPRHRNIARLFSSRRLRPRGRPPGGGIWRKVDRPPIPKDPTSPLRTSRDGFTAKPYDLAAARVHHAKAEVVQKSSPPMARRLQVSPPWAGRDSTP